MKNHRSIRSGLLLIWASSLSLVAPLAQAGTCAANTPTPGKPDSAYADNGNGTVTHVPTGLVWKRCAEGQTWDGSTCSGNANTQTWAQALTQAASSNFAGQNDWRLPNIKELRSLAEPCRISPAVNDTVFPATPSTNFWSGSPSTAYAGKSWVVHFFNGFAGNSGRSSKGALRLVRSGQATDVGGTSSATATPVCTLTASPVVIAAGGRATLTANCTPAATAYAWTNSGFAFTAASGSVSPTAPTRYSVTGSNAAGSGNAASADVYVCNTPALQNYPGLVLGGATGSDQLASGAGNDAFDGAAGVDTVMYNCNRSNFTLTKTASGWTVRSPAEGLDTLTNVERIRFGDETLALDLDGNAGKTYRLYQAAFNRKPDGAGLKYWIGQMDGGMDLQEVALRFIGSDEFRTLYGANAGHADFLNKLYDNVLHRTPDAAGHAWWLDQLNTGKHSQATVLMGFSESPENQAGVLQSIINGIDLPN